MGQGDILGVGILLVVMGVVFWLLPRFLLRAAPGVVGAGTLPVMPPQVGRAGQIEALITVQPGGRILQMNAPARALFHLNETDLPNLERISRRIRPGEKFMELCAMEGQAQLVIEGGHYAASSYWVGAYPQPVMLLALRHFEPVSDSAQLPQSAGEKSLQLVAQLTQDMGQSLELDATLQDILQSVEKILQADLIEICIWESDSDQLVAYRFVGAEGAERTLESEKIRYRLGESYAGIMARELRPMRVSDLPRHVDLRLSGGRGAETLQTLVATPLLVQNTLVGTLAAGSLTENAFSEEDFHLLQLLAKPAAMALSNARRFRDEQRRAAELSGLAQLAQGFSSARDPKNLFSRLVGSITPLIQVDILGFLIYNEGTRTLEGQEPIFGMPAQFVEIYRVPVLPNSPAERMLLNQDLIITENAAESSEWEALGLSFLARAASLHDTVLVPLTSGGRMLGYLQAANHHDGSDVFTQDEIHLLTIVANQAAPVIENVTLVMQARQRMQRAESLRRIASLASSAAHLDEILKFAVTELSHLLRADLGFIFLLDEGQTLLRLHQRSLFGQKQSFPGLITAMAGDDPQYHFTITGSTHTLATANINEEKTIIPFYQQITQAWQVVSAVAAPLVVRDAGIGEIWLCSRHPAAFDQGDLQAVATAAGQLAAVVEQNILSVQTDESLRRRVDQLTALMRVSRELNSSRDLKGLLNIVYDEALNITGVACGSIVLFDQSLPGDLPPVSLFTTGDAPPDPLGETELHALRSGEPVVISSLAQAAVEPPHAGVIGLLVVPIRYQARSVGLILLHGDSPNSFPEDVVAVIQSLAAQTALALEDAYLYRGKQLRDEWMQRQLKLIEHLRLLSDIIRSDRPLPEVLTEIATSIRTLTPFQVVVVSVYEPRFEMLRRVVGAGLGVEAWEELQGHTQPWVSLQPFFNSKFKIGDCYFIPINAAPLVPADVHFVTVLDIDKEDAHTQNNSWHADDMLLVPLLGQQGLPLGLISLDAPIDGRKPDGVTFSTLEILASQAALAIENWQQIAERDNRLAGFAAEQNRLIQSAEQAQVQVPLFLRHDLEHNITIHNLNRQMERVRAGLEIAETANRQPDSLAVLRSLAREMLTRFDMQTAMVAESTPAGIRLLDVIGVVPASANPEALFGQRNPLRQALQEGALEMVADLDEKSEWRGTPLLAVMSARSFIVLPLEIEADHRGGVLAMGVRSLAPFSEEDRQIYAQLSRQVSLGAQNLNLLSETRRRLREMDLLLSFSRKLGLLDPREILAALIDTVLDVLSAGDAGWVAIWDEARGLLPQVAHGYSDDAAMLAISYQRNDFAGPQPLPLRVLDTEMPLRVDVAFAQDYSLPAEDLLHYRRATGGRLPVSTLVVPIGRGSRVLGVLVVDHFSLSNAFSVEDETLALTLAQQSALALENARLFVSAEQRAAQLQALNMAAGAITSSLQHGDLVSVLLNEIHYVLPYETATLWLRKDNTLSVGAALGFADNESRQGISVAVQDSALFHEMVSTSQPLLVPDVRLDERFPSLLEPDHLSWLGIPLMAKAELIGVIALEKHEPGFYTADHLQAATTFASQAGVALENARLFDESMRRAAELDQRTKRLMLLNRLSSDLGSTLNEQTILHLTCQQLHGALNASRVAALLIGKGEELTVSVEVPAGPEALPIPLPGAPLIDRLRETQGIFSTIDLPGEVDLRPLLQAYFSAREVQSVVFVPLVTAVQLHGWLLVQMHTAYRFNSSEIELARTMSNQAAVALQNARLYDETHRLTQDLEKRVEERTHEVLREHNNTQALLRIITELSSSLDLNLVMNRTLLVLTETLAAEQSMILLNDGKTYTAGVELIAQDPHGLPRRGSIEREVARWIARRRVPALVDDILEDARWNTFIKPGEAPVYRSMIAVPLILGEEVSGVLLLIHRRPAAFMIEQVSMVEATARQFGVALNNAELFTLIRDQAENLGGLLREQQIEASRSRAILESVADGVVVTDASMRITLFNASAERILNLKSADAMGKLLEDFAGLLGNAGEVWHRTIQRWSVANEELTAGETYAEQINLDNSRVVAVNLAPVFFRGQFLATVSIFRDITHEVQVDRLKSEFVANVSHELRTPMTSIKGYVEIMLMGAAGELNPQQRHFLEIVKGNTERLKILVNDLLDVSKIEAGGVVLSLQAINLGEIVAEVITDLQRRSRQENKAMKFQVDIAADLPRVMGDVVRIRQVLANLVTNGYNYTPEEGCVTVRIRDLGSQVQVEVIDNGIGIASKDQARIFERFYRGEDPLILATAGTGLGLAISKIIIDMHHGQIGFFSSGVRGEGSTFYFTLPVAHNEE